MESHCPLYPLPATAVCAASGKLILLLIFFFNSTIMKLTVFTEKLAVTQLSSQIYEKSRNRKLPVILIELGLRQVQI